ncbi:MAG: FAD-dependent oxidoreductase [Solirubrobacteraceae bacterium]
MGRYPKRIVVVGASLAGLRSAEALRAEGFEGELVIVGEEPRRPYDRPPLSKALLAGTVEPGEIALREFRAIEAQWLLGDPAGRLDLAAGAVTTRSGRTVTFDRLLIATGSRPRRLPALDPGHAGVHELRTLDDALALRTGLRERPRLAIVGAGFIGTEVASTATTLGLEVEMISLDPPLAVAGAMVADFTADLLSAHGVRLHVRRSVAAVEGNGRVERLILDDGSHVESDLVLSAVGAAPATDWLRGSGLQVDNGVVCDPWCAATGVPTVAAAGDVARWPNALFGPTPIRIEHWTNAGEQARVAAHTLIHGSGHGQPHRSVPSFWSEHFGVRLQSIGLPGLGDRFELLEGDPREQKFVAAARRGGRLVGAVAYGMPRSLALLRKQLEASTGRLP